MAVGVAALAAAAWLLAMHSPYRAMAVPLAVLALAELGVGGWVFLRTDRQVAALDAKLAADPAAFRAAEAPRMERVMANFRLYRAAEIAVLAGGVALILCFRHRPALLGAGLGCALQAGILLVLDLFAERRGAAYLEAVRRLAPAP